MENNDIRKKIELLQNIIRNLGEINASFYAEIARLRDLSASEKRVANETIKEMRETEETLVTENGILKGRLEELEEANKRLIEETVFLRQQLDFQRSKQEKESQELINGIKLMIDSKKTADANIQKVANLYEEYSDSFNDVRHQNEVLYRKLLEVFGTLAEDPLSVAKYMLLEREQKKSETGDISSASNDEEDVPEEAGFSETQRPEDFGN